MTGQYVCYNGAGHPYPYNGQNIAYWKHQVRSQYDAATKTLKLLCPMCGAQLIEE